MNDAYAVMRFDDVERQPSIHHPFVIHLIRRSLGVRAFGINAYTGPDAGDVVIEEHDEIGGGAGTHEELYMVLNGKALFRVNGNEHEVAAGDMLFVRDPRARRGATAAEPRTTVLVIGGQPAERDVPGAWEWAAAATTAYLEKDYEQAFAIAREGLETSPGSPALLYNLACFAALAGRSDEAMTFLSEAVEGDEALVRQWSDGDADLDSLRDRPDWPL